MTNLESLNSIITELTSLIPQLSGFINQFNEIAIANNIAVITDSVGNMSIEVPDDMPDGTAQTLSKRIGVVDRLINDRGATISDLFKKGYDLESNIRSGNSKYVSQLDGKLSIFRELNKSYKH